MSWFSRFVLGDNAPLHTKLENHFKPNSLNSLAVHERNFPLRVQADLQRAFDVVMNPANVLFFSGVQKTNFATRSADFAAILTNNPKSCEAMIGAPQYEEVDIGETEPVRQLKDGLWLLAEEGRRFAVMLVPQDPFSFMQKPGIRVQIAVPKEASAVQLVQSFFDRLEAAVRAGRSYRGKILSLEQAADYSGRYTGIKKVHKLHAVARENVILPRDILELLDRNVIRFVEQRPRLAKLGLSTKKGLLFYGLPGTGKTHTIHYLASALPGVTTLLITEELVGLLSEYMALARLLQPSMVVIEGADLIARDRNAVGACQEIFLNKLLNEMDGLRADAEILFILTTNRPETLEPALTSRPGRIDQAIEFPLPNEEAREKLLRLYAHAAPITDNVVKATIKLTENASAAFIKELMRRAAQSFLEREGADTILLHDIDAAIQEMMFDGGSLNRKLLGNYRENDDALSN